MSARVLVRAWSYAVAGAVLALGAPLGWLLIRNSAVSSLTEEVAANRGLYAYLTLGTALAFSGFGWAVGRLAEQLAQVNRELEHLAAFDALTGLRNARTFHIELERSCAAARRSRQPMALIMLDLDHFKRVNDAYGHAAGDQALAKTGSLLNELARSADAAFRVGGEEFAVLCSGTDASEAAKLAERVRAEMEARPLTVDGKAAPLTGSFGVATLASGAMADALFRAADGALYAAKAQGRNRVVVAS